VPLADCMHHTDIDQRADAAAVITGVIVLLSLIGLVVAGAFLLGKRGGRLDAMRADAAVRHSMWWSMRQLMMNAIMPCLCPLKASFKSCVTSTGKIGQSPQLPCTRGLQAGALVDSDLDEEDENAAKIRETVALARGQLRAAVC
jgi:hypothetical protein